MPLLTVFNISIAIVFWQVFFLSIFAIVYKNVSFSANFNTNI